MPRPELVVRIDNGLCIDIRICCGVVGGRSRIGRSLCGRLNLLLLLSGGLSFLLLPCRLSVLLLICGLRFLLLPCGLIFLLLIRRLRLLLVLDGLRFLLLLGGLLLLGLIDALHICRLRGLSVVDRLVLLVLLSHPLEFERRPVHGDIGPVCLRFPCLPVVAQANRRHQ